MGSRIPTIRLTERRDEMGADTGLTSSEARVLEAKFRDLEIKVAKLEARLDHEIPLLEARVEARLLQTRIFAVKVAIGTATFIVTLLGIALWPMIR